MAQRLRTNGQSLWLLTSGLSLAKHARRVGELFDAVTVSLDGTTAATYAAIRGLDAFDKVCEGIRAAADTAVALSVRVTLQRANYQELPAFVELAHRLGAQQVSFLAVDVANPHAFGRSDEFRADVGLRAEDLPVLAALLCQLQREHAQDFERGFIAENPAKLQRLLQYFTAVHGHGSYPPVRCNAPEFSAVVDAQGRVAPCFFIPGPPAPMFSAAALADLNAPAMRALRQDIEDGRRAECTTCVCSMWREPSTLEHLRFRPAGLGAAPRRWQ
jgi:MoaA/NifB/PqqE/SkfB family radical SAM enzyme